MWFFIFLLKLGESNSETEGKIDFLFFLYGEDNMFEGFLDNCGSSFASTLILIK